MSSENKCFTPEIKKEKRNFYSSQQQCNQFGLEAITENYLVDIIHICSVDSKATEMLELHVLAGTCF